MPKIPAGSVGSPKAPSKGVARPPVGRRRGAVLEKQAKIRGKTSLKALTQFTSQLSTLQDAGLPIVRSLKILEGQLERGPFKSTLVGVAEDVESGSPLSDALAKHPGTFDGLYTNMVKAGEAGGVLDVILSRLAGFMEKAAKLRKKRQGRDDLPGRRHVRDGLDPPPHHDLRRAEVRGGLQADPRPRRAARDHAVRCRRSPASS